MDQKMFQKRTCGRRDRASRSMFRPATRRTPEPSASGDRGWGLYRTGVAGYDASARPEHLARPVLSSDATVRDDSPFLSELAARPWRAIIMASDPKANPAPVSHGTRIDVKGIRV